MADTDNGELDDAVKKLQDRFGAESIMRMGAAKSSDVDTVSTGSLTLDINTGIMGLPRGRIIETMGPESSGKTTIALQSIAEHQKDGIRCAFIDVEHAIDPDYASSLGVDTDQLLLSQPDTGEQALQLVDALVRETDVGFIVVDSVAALLPKAELEGDIGDSHVGLQARMMSQACRKLSGSADENQTTIFFINQIRQKIGVTFGSPETVPGGNALKFFSSMRIDVRRTGQLKDGEELVGNQTKIKIIKNKHAPPFKEANVELVYGKGISKEAELLDLGVHYGVLTKKGSFFYYGSDKLGQGKRQGVNALKEDPDMADQIRSEIVEAALG